MTRARLSDQSSMKALSQNLKVESTKVMHANYLVTNTELLLMWQLFESLQSRSSDKNGLDKDIFYTFIEITVITT